MWDQGRVKKSRKRFAELFAFRSLLWVNVQHLVDEICDRVLDFAGEIFQRHMKVFFACSIFTDSPIIQECFPFYEKLKEDTSKTPNVDFAAEC